MSLTSVLIAHNEQAMLPITLPPIKAISDQVIIVDMGSTDRSHEIYGDLLGKNDLVLTYPRENLYFFGFAHPRNYGAKRAKTDWILAIDCDELIQPEEFLAVKDTLNDTLTNVFDLERLNYVKEDGYSLDNIPDVLASARSTKETHRRLYRNLPRTRWEGMIHEEVWIGEINAYYDCEPFPLRLHHLNQFKVDISAHLKFGLYSYLTLQAIEFPGLRYGTNEFWFLTFPTTNMGAMLNAAGDYARLHNLPPINEGNVRKQLASEGVEIVG
ncbi:glycosyltransferase [Asticcacaulis sp. 201]|uniref:glycosyltransferase n=1 Tax=Asticcacaulis sp. 201 TaxID=3028787 RepID=UPI002916F26F|nr:glycosyltransferase [Asticcacaulis sp. 201]MDV6331039.1 glycosyltransferase [Asticcacaulis sp. 201]